MGKAVQYLVFTDKLAHFTQKPSAKKRPTEGETVGEERFVYNSYDLSFLQEKNHQNFSNTRFTVISWQKLL